MPPASAPCPRTRGRPSTSARTSPAWASTSDGAGGAARRRRTRAARRSSCPRRSMNGSPPYSGSVEERMFAPGAVTSGLSAWPNGVSPPAEKLVGTPGQVVGTSSRSLVNRTVTAPAVPAPAARSLAPSRSEIVPPAPWKIENPGSPAADSATTMPIAPAARARSTFAWYWQPPRLTSAIAPCSDPAGSAPSQRNRFAPAIAPDVDQALVRPESMPAERRPWARRESARGPRATRPRTTHRRRASSSSRPRRSHRARSRASPPCRDRRSPGRSRPRRSGRRRRERRWRRSRSARRCAGSACGPPPEKLITSIPSCTAASNAFTISGVVPEQQPPSGSGTLKTR